PHLHFHVSDKPDALASDGLPYEFSSYFLRGRALSGRALDYAIDKGTSLKLAPHAPTGKRRNQLPLNLDIIDFSSCPVGISPRLAPFTKKRIC
ncbi:hypothetical protein, partial [Streptomyces erythrochromogenes]